MENGIKTLTSLQQVYNEINARLGVGEIRGEFKGEVFKEYGFTKLKDHSDLVITLRGVDLPPSDCKAWIKGTVVLSWKNYYVTPELEVEDYEVLEWKDTKLESYISSKQDLFSHLWKVVNTKDRIRILLISGQNAQTHEDFKRAFYGELASNEFGDEDYSSKVEIIHEEVPLNDEKLAEFLQEYDFSDIDLCCLVRGGGKKDDLKRVGGPKSAKVIVEKDIKLALGLGHSQDANLSELESVAIEVMRPPATLGTNIGRMVKLLFARKDMIKGGVLRKRKSLPMLEVQPGLWNYIWDTLSSLGRLPFKVHVIGKNGKAMKEFMKALYGSLGEHCGAGESRIEVQRSNIPLDDESLLRFFQEVVRKGSDAHLYCILQEEEEEVGGPQTATFIIQNKLAVALGLSTFYPPGSSFLEGAVLAVARPPAYLGAEIGGVVWSYCSWGSDIKTKEELKRVLEKMERKLKDAYLFAILSGVFGLGMFLLFLLK